MSKIKVKSENASYSEEGAAAAIVRRTRAEGKTEHYLLSCYHLFGLLSGPESTGSKVLFDGNEIASFSGISGKILPVGESKWSFDVAFAKVKKSNLDKAFGCLPNPPPRKVLPYIDEMPKTAILHAPRGKITLSELEVKRGNQQIVTFGPELSRVEAVHRVVVKYKANTEKGDSGSPVLSADGQTLLGMHFAGDGTTGFMLPAVELIQNIGRFISEFRNDTVSLAVRSSS